MRLTRQQLSCGSLAVGCFFAISGYLITQSWQNSSSAWSYLKKRICRIYPGFIVATAVCAWIVAPLAGARVSEILHPRFIVEYALSAARLMAHFPFRAFENNPFKGEINGSLWSISFEFWCYIGVLVLGLTGMLKRPLVVLGLFSMAVAFNLHLHLSGWKPGGGILGAIVGYPVFWATVSPLFLGGMLMHLYRDRIAVNGAGAVVCLLGLGAACVIPHGMLVAQPTLGTYLLFCVATTPLIPRFNLVKYGDYSYGVYLYAFPIQQLIMQAIGHSVHPLLLFVLALPPSLIAGALSWYCVERWFLKRSDRSPRAKAGESQEPAIAAIGPGHPPSA